MKFTSRKKTSSVQMILSPEERALAKNAQETSLARIGNDETSLAKSVVNILDGSGNNIERLAFVNDPSEVGKFQGFYQAKLRLLPDYVLKRIAIQDSLVAAIVRIRQNHVASFGVPRAERHGKGFKITPNTGVINALDKEGKAKLAEQIHRATALFNTCGHTEKMDDDESRESFAQYLALSARDAVVVGRIATEIIWTGDGDARKFHAFRAVDAGTIYKACTDSKTVGDSIRDEAFQLIQEASGKTLTPERFKNNDYKWAQVVNGKLMNAFTADEIKCHNFYPASNVELNGYPITPLDTIISAVTTHINITTHNRLYFQNGRAAKGMLVIKSDDVSPSTISNIKQQFMASVNNIQNSWRTPIFGCGADEEISWESIDSGVRDGEFQLLTEQNSREIMAAYQISPDEVPGYQHLSRGGNSQALSEGNNEFKLTASRDVGIRPLLATFEDHINTNLFPFIDPDLAKKAKVVLVGLDTDNREKEAIALQQDSELHMTMDELQMAVEKEPVGKYWGGEIPLNEVFREQILFRCFTMGEILEHFCGREGASKDPALQFRGDPNWFAWQQVINPPAAPEDPGAEEDEESDDEAPEDDKDEELSRTVSQAHDLMTKSEDQLPPDQRRILARQKKTIEYFMRGFLKDAREATLDIVKVADHFKAKK